MTSRLISEVVEVGGVSTYEKDKLYALFEECYDSISYDRFCEDLSGKDHVIILRDRSSDAIRGFSTQQVETWLWKDKKLRTVFSGDTIVHPDYWGEQELVRGWCRYASWVRDQDGSPLYWLLISKGYRTYLYLSLFCRRFYPHHDQVEPDLAGIVAQIAPQKFGDLYDRERGILAFEQSQGHLKAAFADIPEKKKAHPHVAYFLKCNPGYVNGEELVCLAELSDANVRSIAARYFNE